MTDSTSSPMNEQGSISYRLDGAVAVVSIDDGKANALSHAVLEGIENALAKADTDGVKAILLVGRDGKFTAGFDLSVMTAGPTQARDLLARGARLGLALFESERPIVLAVTGHALAMGGILLCCADVRIGADGPYKIGLNEVRIGMPVPTFGVELCRDRLSPRHFNQAVQLGHIHSPGEAMAAGFLDEVHPIESVISRAGEVAAELAESIHPGAFRATRKNVRAELGQTLRDGLEADMKLFDVASPG